MSNNQIIRISINNNSFDSLSSFDSPNEGFKNLNSFSSMERSNLDNNVFFPSVIDAIRLSGGITNFADLTKVKVKRINNLSKGGGSLNSVLNILEALDLKNTNQNQRIFDGDTIFISKTEKPIFSQISKAIKSNLNPKFISVYVGGKVEQPGRITISKSSVLNEAFAIVGGLKTLRGKISFLRYESDGSIDRREFKFNKNLDRGSYQNPYLRNGDIIFVGKSNINIMSEILNEITSPFQSVITSYGFYKLIAE